MYAVEPPVIVFYGLAGCSKTTLATRAAVWWKATYTSPARFGPAHTWDGRPKAFARRRRYVRLFRSLEDLLAVDRAVVIDGCFDLAGTKERLLDLARRYPLRPWFFVRCGTTDIATTKRRLEARKEQPPRWDPEAWDAECFLVTERGFNHYLKDNFSSLSVAVHWSFDSIHRLFRRDSEEGLTPLETAFIISVGAGEDAEISGNGGLI